MSTVDDSLSWNKTATNGNKCFFSEATFTQWVGQDTHESRLLERLKKIDVNLTSPQPARPWIVSESSAPVTSSSTAAYKSDITLSTDISLHQDNYKVRDTLVESQGTKDQVDQQRGTLGSDVGTETPVVHKCENEKEIPTSLGIPTAAHSSSDSSSDVAIIKDDMPHDVKSQAPDLPKTSKQQNSTKLAHIEKILNTEDTNLDQQMCTGDESPDAAVTSTIIRPGFYRDSSEDREETSETVRSPGDTCMTTEQNEDQVLPNTSGEPSNSVSHPTDLPNQINQLQQSETGTAEKEEDLKTLRKRTFELDHMFYDIKDRKAEKYFPEVFKKKPWMRFSSLTSHEQKVYIELLQMYGKATLTEHDLNNESYHKFVQMQEVVSREQQLFQNYLKSISHVCMADYQYLHPEVKKYVTARFLKKKKEAFTYRRYYNFMGRIELTDDIPDSPPTLQYIRPLLKLGHVNKLVLPSILPGLPQPCVTLNCKKINEIMPIVPKVYSGTYVWNNVVCSRDSNAEQLAVPNKCDIVMSSSSIKHLVDNQGAVYKYWDMPFTVREYTLTEGDSQVTQKVVYLDKPIIRQSQFVPKECIQLYQKYAIRASSHRSNQRGHMFCGIKPVHEVVENLTVEDVTEHVKAYEENLKDTFSSSADYTDLDKGSVQKDLRKRKRKGGDSGPKTKGGMFEATEDIDDLETFGMDTSPLGVKSKHLDAKTRKLDTETVEPVLTKTKSKKEKSDMDDLEFLKKELHGIKSLAMKETVNVHKTDSKLKPDHKLDLNKASDASLSVGVKEHAIASKPGAKEPTADTHICGEVINVRNLSCMSEKLQSTSAIKHEQDGTMKYSDEPVESEIKQNTEIKQPACRPNKIKSSGQEAQSNNPKSVNKIPCDKIEDKLQDFVNNIYDADTASDSDEEALVIDVPEDIDSETPNKHKTETSNKHKSVKAQSDDKPNVVSDTNDSGSTTMMDSSIEIQKVDSPIASKKRPSTGKSVTDATTPKRQTRSSATKNESPVVPTTSRVTRSRAQKTEPLTSSTIAAPPETVSVPASRGRKRTSSAVRVTRSRSASVDNVSQQNDPSKHDLTSTADSCQNADKNVSSSKQTSSHKKKKSEEKLQQHTVNKIESGPENSSETQKKCGELTVENNLKYAKTEDTGDKIKNTQQCRKDGKSQTIHKSDSLRDIKVNEEKEKADTAASENVLKKSGGRTSKAEQDKECEGKELPQVSDVKKTFTSNEKSSLTAGGESVFGTLPGMSDNKSKKSNAVTFAANHGMSRCGYPVDGNVTYHQWNLDGTNILIRSKYHGFISGQGLVHLYPKMEYQPNFGFEQDTLSEITQNWISVYTRPNSSLLKARINPFNSEIMMLEYIAYQDLVPLSSNFSQAQAFTDLQVIVEKLKTLPVGEYVLKNNPRKDMYSIMKATEDNQRGTYDLHHHYSSHMKTDTPNPIQWTPLDTDRFLPHQRKSCLIPCTFTPKDMKPAASNAQSKKSKKKGDKSGRGGRGGKGGKRGKNRK